MSEYEKYMKYKKKYLDLKLQLGGKDFTKEEIDSMTPLQLKNNSISLFNQAMLNNNKELLEFLILTKDIEYKSNRYHFENGINEETYIKLVELLLQKKEYNEVKQFLYKIKSEQFYANFANDHKNNKYSKQDQSNIDTNTKNFAIFNSKGATLRNHKKYSYDHLLNQILKRTMELYLPNVALILAANNAEYDFADSDIEYLMEYILTNNRKNEAERLINIEIKLKLLLPRRQDIYNRHRYESIQSNPKRAISFKISDTFKLLIFLNYAVIYFGDKSVNLIKIFFENINLSAGEYKSKVYHRLINYLLNLSRKYNFDENIYKSYTDREKIYSKIKSNIFESLTKIILNRYTNLEFRISILNFLVYFYEDKTISFENYNMYLSSLEIDFITPDMKVLEPMYSKVLFILKKIEPRKNLKFECAREAILDYVIVRRKQMNKYYKEADKNELIKRRLSVKKENIDKELGKHL